MPNTFLYLYPIYEYFHEEIKRLSSHYENDNFIKKELSDYKAAKSVDEQNIIMEIALKKTYNIAEENYFNILNECIDKRYRSQNYSIQFVTFSDTPIDLHLHVKKEDKIIHADITLSDMMDNSIYANAHYLIDQVNSSDLSHLRLSGFHMWDCVEKVAKTAYESGIDVLVDEDLTEFLRMNIKRGSFNVSKFPGYNLNDNFGRGLFLYRPKYPWIYNYFSD